MMHLFWGLLLTLFIAELFPFQNAFLYNQQKGRLLPSRASFVSLSAKKKKQLISDELLTSLSQDLLLNPPASPASPASNLIATDSMLNSNNEVSIVADQVPVIAVVDEEKQRKSKLQSKIKISSTEQPDFVSLGLQDVSIVFGDTAILKNASFSVRSGERVGLVGPNGIGKSTQLKVLAGHIEPSSGLVVKSSARLRVSFLRQEFLDELVLERSLQDELLSAFQEEKNILDEITLYENKVSSAVDDMDAMGILLDKLQDLQARADSIGAYNLVSKVTKAAASLGFLEDDLQRTVGSFSGGWKMRIGLAKILCQDPNILLLDEPTNHMDLDSVVWLEGFLKNQNIPMIIVSHDREFLDQVCNKIVEVEDGKTISYTGNYSKFLDLRRMRLDQWRDKYDKQMRYVQEEEKWIKAAKSNPSLLSTWKARELALEKLRASDEWIASPPKEKKFRFRFPMGPRSSAIVVEGRNLSHGYGSGKYSTLFEKVSFDVERGLRVGFLGPNGSGKSTMLRLIMGMEEPSVGYVEYGGNNIVPSYYAQNQADLLNLEYSVLDALMEVAPDEMSITDIRGLLGQFMFKGDDVDKKIKYLSGGEKARVALCRMMLTPANLLILDEPTNHLDIFAKEVLEEALLAFTGSVVLVSHDRYFMSQAVNTIFEFKNKTITRFDCDYHDYITNFCGEESIKDRIEARYVVGDKFRITNAKEVAVEEKPTKTKNFGGSGVTSGNLYKGIKNAKRFVS